MDRINTESFANWVMRQNPRERFSYNDGCGCLIWQYLKAINAEPRQVGDYHIKLCSGEARPIPNDMRWIASGLRPNEVTHSHGDLQCVGKAQDRARQWLGFSHKMVDYRAEPQFEPARPWLNIPPPPKHTDPNRFDFMKLLRTRVLEDA